MQQRLRLWLTTRVIKTAFGADQFALAPFKQGAAIDAILPIMKPFFFGNFYFVAGGGFIIRAHARKVPILSWDVK